MGPKQAAKPLKSRERRDIVEGRLCETLLARPGKMAEIARPEHAGTEAARGAYLDVMPVHLVPWRILQV
jgi:hypothetical protein